MTSLGRSFLAALALGPLAAGCRSADGSADLAGPERRSTIVSRRVESDGRSRSYQLFVPSTRARPGAPLVVALHGNPGDANAMRQLSGLESVAEDVEFLVAFPDAWTADWNEGCGCTAAEREGVDDLQFVRDLVDAVDREFGVDRGSVFATGFSQGGLFAEHVACRLADVVAAVAVVATTMSVPLARECAPGRPVPFLLIHGDLDPVFPPGGTDDGPYSMLGVRESVDLWVTLNACRGAPRTERVDRVASDLTALQLERHADCSGGSEVVYVLVENGGHTWPGSPVVFDSGLTSQEMSAQEEIVLFFLNHRRSG